MAVILPDRALTAHVRAHPFTRDARGTPMPTAGDQVDVRGPYPGAAQENPDGSWALRVDARCWPLRASDKITDDQGSVWVLGGSPKLHMVPGVSDVDFIEAVGTLEPPKVP